MAEGELVGRKSEEDGVELLVLRHPPVNALSTQLLSDLEGHLGQLPASTRCVILTGDGSYFSAGADLKEIASMGLDQAPRVVARGQELFSRLAGFPAPVIAAINGLAVGGGMELALSADLRVAGDTAKLGQPEVNFGLMPAYGGTQRLPRLVGVAKAKELIFTGSMITAAEALRIGLVNKVVSSGQELRAARDLAHTIAARAPRAVRASKHAIDHGLPLSVAEGIREERESFLTEVLSSSDLGEGLAAFIERRPPKFTGA
jgi:enoyl-CoA hydratase